MKIDRFMFFLGKVVLLTLNTTDDTRVELLTTKNVC